MMRDIDKESKYIRARERVDEVKKFYGSLTSYIIFVIIIVALNYWKGWASSWYHWAIFGWGIGIIVKAFKVFRLNPFMSHDWESRKMKEFMDEDNFDNRR